MQLGASPPVPEPTATASATLEPESEAAVPVTATATSDSCFEWLCGSAGEWANARIRLGDEYQALAPPHGSASVDREDVHLTIDYMPLDAPPSVPPIPSLSAMKAAAAAAVAAASEAAPKRSSVVSEVIDVDEDGLPVPPHGIEIGSFCLAAGNCVGQRRYYKAKLLSVRRSFPPLLVRYMADANGRKSELELPTVLKSYVNLNDVHQWVPPEDRDSEPAEGSSSAEADGGGSIRRPSQDAKERVSRLRERPVKAEIEVLSEAGGLQLHLDPRRVTDGYSGTGYRGVFDDSWHSGYKKERPFITVFEGKYAGRFATVEQAAVQYARLEAGMPPLVIDAPKSQPHSQQKPKQEPRQPQPQPQQLQPQPQQQQQQQAQQQPQQRRQQQQRQAQAQAQQPPGEVHTRGQKKRALSDAGREVLFACETRSVTPSSDLRRSGRERASPLFYS